MYRPLGGLCVATLLFVCGATGFPVLPNSVPPSSGAVVVKFGGVTTTNVTEKGALAVSGGGFAPGTPVSIGVYSSPVTLGTTTSDDAGVIAATVSLPAGLTGSHTLVAIGNAPDASGRALTAGLAIKPAVTAGRLARTGVRTGSMTLAGVLLLVSGFALVRGAGSRRRLLPDRSVGRHFLGRQAYGALDR